MNSFWIYLDTENKLADENLDTGKVDEDEVHCYLGGKIQKTGEVKGI